MIGSISQRRVFVLILRAAIFDLQGVLGPQVWFGPGPEG